MLRLPSKEYNDWRRWLTTDFYLRWVLIFIATVTASIGLMRLKVPVDFFPFMLAGAYAVMIYGFGLAFLWLGARKNSLFSINVSDFLCSAGQLMIFLLLAGALQYIAAATSFPLRDNFFAQIDTFIGFDWLAYKRWVDAHPVVSVALSCAYASIFIQAAVLGVAHCVKPNSNGNSEFVWHVMISIAMVLILAIMFPALGYPGKIGQHHIDVLIAARRGTVQELDGIVTFPSFHAALAILLIYSARSMPWLLAIALPLNIMLILATPPVGGHYLIDVIAGILVAWVTIRLVARLAPTRRLSIQSSPPAGDSMSPYEVKRVEKKGTS